MSRLIVKNIPISTTEDNLRKLFTQAGTLTEVKTKKSKTGKHRGFAFVGYHKESEAEKAIELFHNTFIETRKITVEKCAELKDARDKVKEPKQATVKKREPENEMELLKKYKDDPLFEEFMQVHAPEKTQKLRELIKEPDEDVKEDASEEDDTEVEKTAPVKQEKKKKNIQLYNLKLCNLPWDFKKKDIKDFFKPLKCFSIRMNQRALRIAYVGFTTEKARNKAVLKDKSYIRGCSIKVTKHDSNPAKTNEDEDKHENNNKWKNEKDKLANVESINESGRIFFRNLAYTTTEDDIEKLFSKYGPLSEVSLPFDSTTKIIKGFGTVTFLMPEHAAKAFSELDGTILHGRMLHLLPAKSKDSPLDDDDGTNYKQKKQKLQKATAGHSQNWNALFLDANAVAEVIAERYNTTKAAIVGPEGVGSAPVKLALAETQIVAETKRYLEEMGVKLDAFNKENLKRSKSIILVKNLPSKTSIEEIKEIFEKHGDLGRIILPPSGLTGLIEFVNPAEAKKAFISLAYSKFKNTPLYLEWAPQGSLEEKSKPQENESKKEISSTNHVEDSNTSKEISEQNIQVEKEQDSKNRPKKKPEPNTTLCIKSLDPKITNENLKKHFETCGEVYYAQIQYLRKKSSGIGFVRYFHKSSAEEALQTLQGSNLGNSNIEITKSDRVEDGDVQTTETIQKHKTSTITVKNIPFEATSDEVEKLFSTFGHIKTVRLPRKWNGENSHRGFGFVEFTSVTDAKSAFEALCQSTHLLGRRLILEWAKEEESVDETRKRTLKRFGGPKEKKSKKSVFNIS